MHNGIGVEMVCIVVSAACSRDIHSQNSKSYFQILPLSGTRSDEHVSLHTSKGSRTVVLRASGSPPVNR